MPIPRQTELVTSHSVYQAKFGQQSCFAAEMHNPVLVISRGETVWRIAASQADTFLAESGWKLQTWIASGQAKCIKSGPHRDVYRLVLPTGCFYLKHFKMNDMRAWSRNLLRDCKSSLEEQSAQRLRQAGIPTYQTVAYGWRHQFGLVGESYLISREVSEAKPLDQFVAELRGRKNFPLQAENQYRIKATLARMLGQLMGRLHGQCLLHGDLHTGNFLIQHAEEFLPSGQSGMQLWLIDPYPVSHHRQLTFNQRAANLSLLNNCFFKCSTTGERYRFFQAYFAEWMQYNPGSTEALNNQARLTEKFCRADYKKSLRHSDKKWQRPHSRLIFADRGNVRCRAIAELGQSQVVQLRDKLSEIVLEKQLQGEISCAKITLDLQEQQIACLLFRWQQQRSWFGKTTAQSAWDNGLALHRRGCPTVRPLFFLEKNREQILIVQPIRDVVKAREYINRKLISHNQEQQQDWHKRHAQHFSYLNRKLQDYGFVFQNKQQDWQELLVSDDFHQTHLAIGDPTMITRH